MIPPTLKAFLKRNDFITIEEARKMGVSPMTLSRLVGKELLFRTERGVYTDRLDWLTDPHKKYLPTCARIPGSVIAGISALSYYDLTDEEERQIWIALPAHRRIRDNHFRVIRPQKAAYTLGIETHRFGNRTFRIYDVEKAVVDAFKYLTEEAALKALHRYLGRRTRDVARLSSYSRRLRKPLGNLIRALLAEE